VDGHSSWLTGQAGDMDGGVGEERMNQAWAVLKERTFYLKRPDGKKDANEVFQKGCVGNLESFVRKVNDLTLAAKTPAGRRGQPAKV
jgi:hypothetical protein